MNWRWLMFDYADPDLPLTLRQRIKIAWRPIRFSKLSRSARRGRLFLSMLYGALIGGGMIAIEAIAAPSAGPGLIALATVLYLAGLWILACLVIGVVVRRDYYRRVRLEGFDICPNCGYWLRGLDDDVKECPECGWRRESLVILLAQPSGTTTKEFVREHNNMMTRRQIAVIGALILASLAAYGGYRFGASAWQNAIPTLDGMVATESAYAAKTVRVLRLLRADKHGEAVDELESSLDGNILFLIGISENIKDPLMRKGDRILIWSDIRSYREQYPSQAPDSVARFMKEFWQTSTEETGAP